MEVCVVVSLVLSNDATEDGDGLRLFIGRDGIPGFRNCRGAELEGSDVIKVLVLLVVGGPSSYFVPKVLNPAYVSLHRGNGTSGSLSVKHVESSSHTLRFQRSDLASP